MRGLWFGKLNFKPVLDRGGFTAALDKAIMSLIRGAAIEFIKEVNVRVPVLTGMAKGSIKPLARYLRVSPLLDFSGAKPDRKRGRSQAAGTRLAPAGPYITNHNFVYTFHYSTKVYHYILNDLFPGHAPTAPWESFKAGGEAFNEYLSANLSRKIPRVSKFIRVRANGS